MPPRICTWSPRAFISCPTTPMSATLDMPEVVQGGTLDDAVSQGEQQLVSTIEAEYTAR